MTLTAQELAELMPDATQLESDEPEIESSLHYLQLALLVSCLEWLWRDKNDFFIGANMTIFYSRQQLKNREFRGPDFFLVKNTEKRPRRSWVVWEEDGRYPDLIIELLSDSTAKVDRTVKKDLYQNRFRTQEYYWFFPDDLEFAGFRLVKGKYEPIPTNSNGLFYSDVLGLYLGVEAGKLRYFSADGQLVATPEESALQAQALAEEERQRAERLEARLRALGVDPNEL